MSERPPRPRLELALVVFVAAIVLVPGIWKYSLVDPWETHYGEVARNMLKDNDLVHMQWPGANEQGSLNEGFRSKPVLTFWLMAAGLEAVGVARHGGYSGELVSSVRTMIGLRLPFVLCAIFGLTLVWYMLATLVNRRLAWLALLVIGSCPMFCLIARQAIPDMPLCATTMGAVALFVLAVEDGDRPIEPRRLGRFHYDARHVMFLFAGGFVVLQAIYYAVYFIASPVLAITGQLPHPSLWLPLMMFAMLGGMTRDGWKIVRLPFLLIGGIVAAIVNEPIPHKRPDQSWWRALVEREAIRALEVQAREPLRLPSIFEVEASVMALDDRLKQDPESAKEQLRRWLQDGRIRVGPDDGKIVAEGALLPFVVIADANPKKGTVRNHSSMISHCSTGVAGAGFASLSIRFYTIILPGRTI